MKMILATEAEIVGYFEQAVKNVFGQITPFSSLPAIKQPAKKKEAAAYLGISLSKLNELLRLNELPSFNIGRSVRINWTDLEAFVNKKSN
ncbi:excisionase family DNA-binding protein [Mucilaginibacter sp. KACC 22773]|uniref:excisionase family DNA-binding protein n=1 Tax=Mucilaginibacter sp. KACC 22773 TaxID=3025671 RepID=UPI002365839F|nr:excisionase family DNA-binding protein [Mucilaginibacter sp. KACC 22773]WDF79552.1 excisionase family DNA-binding protein [Mucilaginibacter sp. KACC 22773]